MYIIGFNGPPQCGKDTLAGLLTKEIESRHSTIPVLETSLSRPLRTISYAMVGLDYEQEHKQLPYEEFKRTHFPQFDRTGRELMIDVSERFLKIQYGQDIMASLLIASLANWKDKQCVVMIRDCGFRVEVNPIIDFADGDNFLMVQVHRPSFDSFERDSREWVTHPSGYMNTVIQNTGTLEDLETEAARLYGRLVNQKGWTLA